MTKTFAKAACLRYIDSGEDYYELQSLEALDELLKSRWSPVQSIDFEVNANVGPHVDESSMDAVPIDDDDWDFEGAVGLDEAERVGVKRRF